MTTYHPESCPNIHRFSKRKDKKYAHVSCMGITGLPEEDVCKILQEWEGDNSHHCHMDFSLKADTPKVFFKSDEDFNEYTPILIGKEVGQHYYKGVFRTKDGNIIMRSAVHSDSKEYWFNKPVKSGVYGWTIQRNIFDADESFIEKLKAIMIK